MSRTQLPLAHVQAAALLLSLASCATSAPRAAPASTEPPTSVGAVNMVAWCEALVDASKQIYASSQAALANQAESTIPFAPLPANDAPEVRARLDRLTGPARACAICSGLDPCNNPLDPFVGAVGVRHLAAQLLALHNIAVADIDTDPRLPPAGPSFARVYSRSCSQCTSWEAPAAARPLDPASLVAACRALRARIEAAAAARAPRSDVPPQLEPKSDCQELERCGLHAMAALPADAKGTVWRLTAAEVSRLGAAPAGAATAEAPAESATLRDALSSACAAEWSR